MKIYNDELGWYETSKIDTAVEYINQYPKSYDFDISASRDDTTSIREIIEEIKSRVHHIIK
jgi:hypothetical protein